MKSLWLAILGFLFVPAFAFAQCAPGYGPYTGPTQDLCQQNATLTPFNVGFTVSKLPDNGGIDGAQRYHRGSVPFDFGSSTVASFTHGFESRYTNKTALKSRGFFCAKSGAKQTLDRERK
jgi:hypothetical protein